MANWTNKTKTNFLGLILTDELFEVWLGENEDEVLVWNLPLVWSGLLKN
jgi:hypothetical protein